MYSYEINGIMKKHNYRIPSNVYLRICKTSPQIKRVKYEPFENSFEIWTDDKAYWKFEVYLNETAPQE